MSNTSLQNYKTPIRAYDPDGEPPEYEWRASESETPKDISEDVHTLTYRTEIYRIFTLPANLSMIPRERFKRKTTKQGEYYVIHYKIKMTILGEVMRWELIFDGKSYGSIDAVFE